MATDIAKGELEVARPGLRIGWATGALAALALAGVVVTAVAVLSQAPSVPSVGGRTVPLLYTKDELTVIELAAKGLIPEETLEGEPFRTKRLIAHGLIPGATLDARPVPVEPVYCQGDQAVIAAVAAGVVPDEVLDGEPYRTKRFIAKGLIPREAVPPCS